VDSRLVVEQVLGDGRVAARGGVGQVEDQGEVQRVGPGGQCFVQDPVAADAFEVDAVVQQVPLEVFGTDRPGSQGCLRVDQDVPVGSLGQVARRWASQASRV
jgi:hypothetical protein